MWRLFLCFLYNYRFLEEYSKWLPPNHFTLCDVELTLTQAIGSDGPISFQTVPEERLQIKINLCRKLLKLVNILAAGSLIIQCNCSIFSFVSFLFRFLFLFSFISFMKPSVVPWAHCILNYTLD